ncbi:VOC family protein [Sporosarcina aquimarina]|uniref:VOC family protein n=1 Tax=Sporosarcina aquimarina TaxID=114975 RepID=UPI00203FCAF2|nr:VOC family protein [Sporosarcina aquimarina]MCM3758867.1 VOC family protein [Sporosarcina aquimarina]
MKLDHVVWFTERTPEVVAKQYPGAVVGGRHEHWGTYNALLYLQNAYIEWLAIENTDVADFSSHPLVELLKHDLATYGEGWGTLCISTDNIQLLNKNLERMGMHTSGVLDASRLTSSGTLKKWKMLFVNEKDLTDLPAPFFIQWEESEQNRRLSLRTEGVITKNSDAERILECGLVTKDPKQALERWCRILGVQPEDKESLMLNDIRLRFIENPKERNRMHTVVTGQAE